MVRRTVISPAHQDSRPDAHIYPRSISGFSTMRVRCSRQLRGTYDDFVKSQDDKPAHSLEGADGDRVCVCAFIRVSVRAYV